METFDSGAKFSWDHARTMRMGITGAFLVTPASFSWNLYAERIAPGTSLRAIVTKLGVSIAVLPPMVSGTRKSQRGAPSATFLLDRIKPSLCRCARFLLPDVDDRSFLTCSAMCVLSKG